MNLLDIIEALFNRGGNCPKERRQFFHISNLEGPMTKKTFWLSLPLCMVIALLAAFLFVSPAFAQDEVPPEVVPTEAPAEVLPTEAVPTGELLPTEVAPAEELPVEPPRWKKHPSRTQPGGSAGCRGCGAGGFER